MAGVRQAGVAKCERKCNEAQDALNVDSKRAAPSYHARKKEHGWKRKDCNFYSCNGMSVKDCSLSHAVNTPRMTLTQARAVDFDVADGNALEVSEDGLTHEPVDHVKYGDDIPTPPSAGVSRAAEQFHIAVSVGNHIGPADTLGHCRNNDCLLSFSCTVLPTRRASRPLSSGARSLELMLSETA